MRRMVCVFVVRKPPKTGFLASRPICASSLEFGSYRICEQRMLRRDCAYAQSRQSLLASHNIKRRRWWRLMPNFKLLAPIHRCVCTFIAFICAYALSTKRLWAGTFTDSYRFHANAYYVSLVPAYHFPVAINHPYWNKRATRVKVKWEVTTILLVSWIYTWQQKKRIFFNIHLTPQTLIKFYPKWYEHVWTDSFVRSRPFYSSILSQLLFFVHECKKRKNSAVHWKRHVLNPIPLHVSRTQCNR